MITLVFDTRPVPWSRTATGKSGQKYTPNVQRAYMYDLAMMLKVVAKGETFEGAVKAQLRFDYKRNQTLIQLSDASHREDLKITRADCDNLVKMVLESVQKSGIVKDDAQIAILEAEKTK